MIAVDVVFRQLPACVRNGDSVVTDPAMLIAPTFKFIEEKIQHHFIQRRLNLGGGSEGRFMEYMRPGDMYETLIDTGRVQLIGIVLVNPDSQLGKRDIIPRLGQYHQRAAFNTDFFFGGYGAYWPNEMYPDQRIVAELDGTKWLFSDHAFEQFRKDVQEQTEWEYSGESDLILTTARYSKDAESVVVEYFESLSLCLEQVIRDKAYNSIPALFEKIFRFGETSEDKSILALSNQHLLNKSRESLLEAVLSKVGMEKYYKKNRSFAVRDLSKAPKVKKEER